MTARLKALALAATQYPVVACPKCGDEQDDMDGFGFLACDKCGYCTHPSVTQNVCGICLAAISEETP